MNKTDVKIYLKNFDDLMNFLRLNYEYIDENSYYHLVANTLNVFPVEKPEDKDKALKDLETFWFKYNNEKESPVFLHFDFNDYE